MNNVFKNILQLRRNQEEIERLKLNWKQQLEEQKRQSEEKLLKEVAKQVGL